jgi:glycosyltransferase involved in cell wall biosynthesis
MNIMLLADHYPPVSIGGGETHVESLARSLQKRGHKVIVCTLANNRLPSYEKNGGISIYRIEGIFQKASFLFRDPTQKLHPPIMDPLIVKTLKMIIKKEKPEIIHTHSSGGWIVYSALALRKEFGIPLVVTLHSYGLICPVMTLTKDGEQCQSVLTSKCVGCGREVYGAKSLLVYSLLKLNRSRLKHVDRFVAISDYQRSVYSKHLGFKETDIVVIPNSIDFERFSQSEDDSEKTRREFEKLGVDHDSYKIIHISAVSRAKLSSIVGIIYATPKIIEKFPFTQVLIVGNGGYFDKVASLVRKVNQKLEKQAIIMTGFVKNDDMPKTMSLADIVVGVGRVALEAMACGKPVVIAGTSVGPFGGNYGGIVTKSNVDELRAHNFSGRNSAVRTTPDKIAEDCMKLLENREYRLSVGKFGKHYVEKEHNLEKEVRRVEAMYLDVIGGSK